MTFSSVHLQAASPRAIKEEPVKVMCLGGAVTAGTMESPSYRFELWKRLISDGWNVDFVGSQKDIRDYPAHHGFQFDGDHEGHSELSPNQLAARVDGLMEDYQPDIILLHMGQHVPSLPTVYVHAYTKNTTF